MHRIDSSTATPDNRFTAGNPTIPIQPTTVTADWLNSVQEELVAILAAAKINPAKADNTQVLAALRLLISNAQPGIATTTANGVSRPDGVTVKIDGAGKLSAALPGIATNEVNGISRPDGATVKIDKAGKLSATQPTIASNSVNGISRPDGATVKIDSGGRLSAVPASKYEVGEFYYFRHPWLRPGFQPAQGGVITNAATRYPDIWAYLQTDAGRRLCLSEGDWQARTRDTWHTCADGAKIGWDGIGGAPWYVQDLGAGTLRMPDLRGMYAEAAGFDGLDAGGVHGDAVRNITGKFTFVDLGANGLVEFPSGCFVQMVRTAAERNGGSGNGGYNAEWGVMFDLARQAPVAAKNQPRAWGALACCYLGTPK